MTENFEQKKWKKTPKKHFLLLVCSLWCIIPLLWFTEDQVWEAQFSSKVSWKKRNASAAEQFQSPITRSEACNCISKSASGGWNVPYEVKCGRLTHPWNTVMEINIHIPTYVSKPAVPNYLFHIHCMCYYCMCVASEDENWQICHKLKVKTFSSRSFLDKYV